MSLLLLTENTRKAPALRAVFGDASGNAPLGVRSSAAQDTCVRQLPMPLYRFKPGKVASDAAGYPEPERVTKNIDELRKTASKYDEVLVVLPPTAFWYDVAWHVRKALAGVRARLWFKFPSDLSELNTEWQADIPSTTAGSGQAFDCVFRDATKATLSTPDFTPDLTRPVTVALAYLAKEATGVSTACAVAADFNFFGIPASVELPSMPDCNAAEVVSVTLDYCDDPVMPPRLPTAASWLCEALEDLDVFPSDMLTAVDQLYASGCISCPESDTRLSDAALDSAVAYLEHFGVAPDCICIPHPWPFGVYATGKEPQTAVAPFVAAVLDYFRSRTALVCCSAAPRKYVRASLVLDFGSAGRHDLVVIGSECSAFPPAWFNLSRSREDYGLCAFSVGMRLHFDTRAVVGLEFPAASVVSALCSLGLSPREAATGLETGARQTSAVFSYNQHAGRWLVGLTPRGLWLAQALTEYWPQVMSLGHQLLYTQLMASRRPGVIEDALAWVGQNIPQCDPSTVDRPGMTGISAVFQGSGLQVNCWPSVSDSNEDVSPRLAALLPSPQGWSALNSNQTTALPCLN